LVSTPASRNVVVVGAEQQRRQSQTEEFQLMIDEVKKQKLTRK
jgi:hypothetical protein